jgi:hypothetical protein
MKKLVAEITLAITFMSIFSVPVYLNWDGIQNLIAEAHCRTYCRASRSANSTWNGFVSQGNTLTGGDFHSNNKGPSLYYIGNNFVQMYEGDVYVDEGATADDFEDGDLTDDIVVKNLVTETTPAGTHVIRYEVFDSDGFGDYDERTVIVKAPGECFLPYITSQTEIAVEKGVVFTYNIEAALSTSTPYITMGSLPGGLEFNYGEKIENGVSVPVTDPDDPEASGPQIFGIYDNPIPFEIDMEIENECGSVDAQMTIYVNLANASLPGGGGDDDDDDGNDGVGNVSQAVIDAIAANQSAGGSAGGGGGSGSSLTQPFGGTVVLSMYCACSAAWVFFQVPVAGVAGPYLVYPTSIKREGNGIVSIGKNVIGTSDSGGTCSIYVIYWCFDFETQQTVTFDPGMGTS